MPALASGRTPHGPVDFYPNPVGQQVPFKADESVKEQPKRRGPGGRSSLLVQGIQVTR